MWSNVSHVKIWFAQYVAFNCIVFFFASCFFVDDAAKSNISVTTCPTVSFIKQTSDLSTRPHTVNGGTKEETISFKDLAKKL